MDIRKNLVTKIQTIIAASKKAAIRSVDHQWVRMYWSIGQKIFEEKQGGKERAGYGEMLLKSLAAELEPQYGSSLSFRQLNLFRQFYCTFPIASTLRTQFSWTHYRMLRRLTKQKSGNFTWLRLKIYHTRTQTIT